MEFHQIKCSDTINDCLDISGSNTVGSQLIAINSLDKGLSIGENSIVNIKDLLVKNSNIGFAIKDGSVVSLENVKSLDNNYDIASTIMILYFTIGILFALFMEIVVDRVRYELLDEGLEWNSFIRILAIVFWPICSVIFVVGFIKRWNR